MSLRLSQLDNLYQRAKTIRDEVMRNANTALRVGSLFYDIIAALASVSIDELRQMFLTKEEDDKTPHKLTMGAAEVTGDAAIDGNMTVEGNSAIAGKEIVKGAGGTEWGDGEFETGTSGAKVWKESGGWHGQLDYLYVTKKFTVKELEIMHESHIGGSLVISAANCVVDEVEKITNAYRVWFLAEDGDGKRVYNMWKLGDFARCQTANLSNDGSAISNRYYWRMVGAASSSPVERNGRLYHYIVLVDTLPYKDEESDEPEAGDEIVQMGHIADESRQGVIMLTSVVNGEQASVPFIRIYKGVGSEERNKRGDIVRGRFEMPKARIDLNPWDPHMDVSQLTITAQGESTKTMDEYIREREPDGVLVITGDTDDAPTTDDEFIDECLATLELEQKEDMVGAFYVTTEWRIWQYQEDYTWKEVTDTNLKSLLEGFEEQKDEIDNAKDRLDNLEERTTSQALQAVIADYASGNLVGKSTFNTWKEGVELYTTWLDPVKQAAGTTGLLTYLNSLFIGTTSVTFNAQGQVTNIDKSGLVTETGYAALFASQMDSRKVATQAYVAAAVANGVSSITISADRVNISSGDKTLGNVFSLDGATGDVTMHDLYARNITLEGVLNNLIQEINSISDFAKYGKYDLDGRSKVLTWYINPLKIGQFIKLTDNLKAVFTTEAINLLVIKLPVAYHDNTGTVIMPLTQDGSEPLYSLAEVRQMVNKSFHFEAFANLKVQVEADANLLFAKRTAYNENPKNSTISDKFVINALNTDTDYYERGLVTRKSIIEENPAVKYVYWWMCKEGYFNEHECIYWEIEHRGNALTESTVE